MPSKIHFTVSLILGLIFGLIFQSYLIGILTWLVGWLIDCDHLLDYFIYLRKFKTKFSFREFFSVNFFKKLGKIYVLAHAWEYLFIFLIGSFFYKLSFPFIVAIGSSYGLHLLMDQFTNNIHPLMYFLLYRIKVGFNVNKLCKG